jgi:transcriptional regulator with XRE-family HTH domain
MIPGVTGLTLNAVVGQNLKRIREEYNWSQADLSMRLAAWLDGWTRDTVASVELGRRSVSLGELFVLAMGFEVPITDFFAGDYDLEVPVEFGADRLIGTGLEGIRAVIAGGDELDEWKRKRRAKGKARDAELEQLKAKLARMEAEVARAEAEAARTEAEVARTTGILDGIWERLRAADDPRTQSFLTDPAPAIADELGLSGRTVQNRAQRLWGQSVFAEYLRRLAPRFGEDISPRSWGAVRGHTLRQMKAELAGAAGRKG